MGGDQDSNTEVELQIATSATIETSPGINEYWSSRPVSMTNSDHPEPPKWATQWGVRDKNAYLAPMPTPTGP